MSLIERFAAMPPDQLGSIHPLFDCTSPGDWDVLPYRPRSPLRQFGV